MKWFEFLIIAIAIVLVIAPVATNIIKRRKGTLKCECGHLQKDCINDCGKCKTLSDDINGIRKTPKFKHKYLIHVMGMKCEMCEAHINDIIRKNFDVNYVKSFRHKDLTVVTTDDELIFERIAETIKKAGYDVDSIEKLF